MLFALPILIPLLHVVLALAVTAHVLLFRRGADTGIAWIGLAWLAPFAGTLLYLLLGINRVRRTARNRRAPLLRERQDEPAGSTCRTDYLAALETAGDRITRRRLLKGNSLRLLSNGDEAYPEMLQAIREARSSVALCCYLFRDDAAGREFIEALNAAVARQVQVRVLIDAIGSGYFVPSAYWHMHRLGVPVARFMHSPLPWQMPFLNLRNHKKMLVTDGERAFTGGLNIGNENLTRTQPKHVVFDTHFRVEGPVVQQLMRTFAEDWRFATGERLSGESWFPSLPERGTTLARAVTSGPDEDIEKIEFLMLEAIGCARHRIHLMTPYFLPDQRLITALALAAYRGVSVDIVLPARSNHVTLDWASRPQIEPLLEAGCHVWLHPAPFNHSKLMTMDSDWAFIGSANWDLRSLRLNFEMNVEFHNSEVVHEIDALIERQKTHALSLADLNRQPLAARLRDGMARLLLPYL